MSRTIKKPYSGTKRWDKHCRNHGGCKWCFGNKMVKHLRKEDKKDFTTSEEPSIMIVMGD